MRAWPLFFTVATVAALAACSRAPSATADPAASAAPSAIPKGVLALGAPVSGAAITVPLADIAKNPGAYANKTVTTTGKVTAVCQARGCWMELQDAVGEAHVKMHGHSFFVPKTAAGHLAKVQATVLSGDVEHCEESPPPEPGKALAKVELDATGVELD